ncbi:MAG TPA: ABC transporter permease [Acidimicrobiales bacterium]|nr:ABC transporter permease [Acidimicrobiales bacterium]
MRAFTAQLKLEVLLTMRRGESVLLTLGIPVVLLVFFSSVDILPIDIDDPIDFLAPGVLALAIMSTSMVSVAIATGFERSYGVLKRLGVTPLGRPRLLAAKTGAVVVVELVQLAILIPVGLLLGWSPSVSASIIPAVVLGTAAFAGLGFLMAGTLDALATLALANGVYLILLLIGGFIVPIDELPGPMQTVAELLPSAALADTVGASLTAGASAAARSWIVLAVWALVTPVVAARTFRWE